MAKFRALLIEKTDDGKFTRRLTDRDTAELPDNDVLIEVRYSSLNYKDGMSATGNPGVTRKFPHTPGIDAAGVVIESTDSRFNTGDEVVVIGFDLGMNTPGGFGQRIRIPADWIVAMPAGLTFETSMILGTAGFTAALCVDKLLNAGMTPASGPVLVTGATGGVGSVAVNLLAKLGHDVIAVTGKPDQAGFLKGLGATDIMTREEASEGSAKPLLGERFGGAVDTVGGDILFNAVKSLKYGCSLAACGLVSSPQIPATVLPFILRHVNLLGIDSVQLPVAQKQAIWQKLATDWTLPNLAELKVDLNLTTVSDAIDKILLGEMVGRGVVDLSA